MPSYLIYHAESGSVISEIKLPDESFLEYQNFPGYSLLEIAENRQITPDLWIDPTTSEFQKCIPFKFEDDRIYTTLDEEVVVPVVKPCWISVGGEVPIYCASGQFQTLRNSESRVTLALMGAYQSNTLDIIWTTLADARERALAKVDTMAEEARAFEQTPGSGQATTYLRKADSARAYLQGIELSEAQLARLQDEADRIGGTLTQAAEGLVAIADAWEARDAEIDRLRLVAKAAINETTSGNEMNAIIKAIVWP